MFNEEELSHNSPHHHFGGVDHSPTVAVDHNHQGVAVVDFVNLDNTSSINIDPSPSLMNAQQQLHHQHVVDITEEKISFEPQQVQMYSLRGGDGDSGGDVDDNEITVHQQHKTQLDEMLEFEKNDSDEQKTSPKSTIGKITKYFKDEFQFKSRKLNVFYMSHFLASWGDRMWAFALPVIFGDMFPETLLPMALMGFIQKLVGIIFGPHMGYMVDTLPRFRVMSVALLVQNISVAVTTTLIFLLGYFGWREAGEGSQSKTDPDALFIWPFETTLSIVLFFSCALVGSLSDLSSLVTSVARTKDWCLVVARGEKLPLERINSMMRRLDMISLIVSPVLFGLILTFAGYKVGAIVVCLWNVFSLVPEYICIHYVYKNTKELHITKLEQELKIKEERDKELLEANGDEGMEQIELSDEKKEETNTINLKHQNIFKILYMGWKSYLTQKVFLSSLAFVFLFITVLTHSGLLLSYLKSHNIHSAILGTFQALSAISGLLSTFVAPYLIMRINVFRGGLVSIYFQFFSLVMGVLCFIVFNFYTEDFYFTVYFFLSGIILSRLGLYAFDLAEIQIMQQLIDQKDSGIVNSTEGSLTKIADLVVFFSALFFSTPSKFIFLVCGSLCCVGIAVLLYTLWYLRNKSNMNRWLKEIEEEELKRSNK